MREGLTRTANRRSNRGDCVALCEKLCRLLQFVFWDLLPYLHLSYLVIVNRAHASGFAKLGCWHWIALVRVFPAVW